MFLAFLMGLVGGQRAMTPLAAVALAVASDLLPPGSGAPRFLAHPVVVTGAMALAVAEMAGDKQKTAPDRTVAIGITARLLTSAFAGAALVPREQRWQGAAVGGVTAALASYPGWRARMHAMKSASQTSTGLVEDAAVLAGAAAIVLLSSRASS